MSKSKKTWSFREIDEQRDVDKGSAFRAFKQLKDYFDEGRDFYYLHVSEDADEIEKLRRDHRIYSSTVNAVLLTESGYSAVIDYLDG